MKHPNTDYTIPTTLTIAGSDPSGGAGLQADLKTFSRFSVFGMTAVTALTIGNTTGVHDIIKMDPATICRQIRAVIADIPPQSIKTGLMGSEEIIKNVAEELQKHPTCPIVVDPVMATKRGDVLASDKEVQAYKSYLLPHAEVATPNIPEAELLADMTITSPDAMPEAVEKIMRFGCKSVVIKGGYFDDWEQSNDLFYDNIETKWLSSPRIPSKHTHGSGDAFSAAITAEIAKGKNRQQAIQNAKNMVVEAIRNAPQLGEGRGPLEYNLD